MSFSRVFAYLLIPVASLVIVAAGATLAGAGWSLPWSPAFPDPKVRRRFLLSRVALGVFILAGPSLSLLHPPVWAQAIAFPIALAAVAATLLLGPGSMFRRRRRTR